MGQLIVIKRVMNINTSWVLETVSIKIGLEKEV